MMKSFFHHLEMFLSKSRINWVKTIYLNFRLMSFDKACRLPIYVYGKCQIVDTSGEINFTCPIKRGMVVFGKNTDHFFADQKSLIVISKGCTITFEGPALFGSGCTWRLTHRGSVTLGECVRFGSGTKILSEDSIYIGKYTGCAYCCQIMNTNFHFVLDTSKNIVYRNTSPVSIGAYNWIGNHSTIMKGTKTKDFTIVASGSLLNKDYILTVDCNDSVMLAGSPAKFIASGKKRIFSYNLENNIREYFRNNDLDFYKWDGMTDWFEDIHSIFNN